MSDLIAHMSTGEGDAVVLLNGGLMTMAGWEAIAGPLSATYRVIRCDFRGQLMSPGEPPATLDAHVADVISVLDTLDVSTVHVVGASFGAIVGIAIAATHSERVRSLIAGTTTAHIQDEEWAATQPLLEACRAGDGGLVMDHLIPAMFSESYRVANQTLLAGVRARVSALSPEYFAGLQGILGLLQGLDLRQLLKAIRCRTLIVAAENDRIFPLARSLELARGIAGSRLNIIPGASHGLFVEEPARIVSLITTFLQTTNQPGTAEIPNT